MNNKILSLIFKQYLDDLFYKKTINHIKSMISDGCCIIDVGAESTKSGFKEVSADKQLNRIAHQICVQNVTIQINLYT